MYVDYYSRTFNNQNHKKMIEKIQIISNVLLIASELFVVIFVAKILSQVNKTKKRLDKFDKLADNCMRKIEIIEKEWKMKI